MKLLNDDTTNKLLQFIYKMTDDKNDMKFKCATFNGDTADGRTKWPDWLRDIELVLDEWSWLSYCFYPEIAKSSLMPACNNTR